MLEALSHPACQRLTIALAHFLWQGFAIALALAVIVWALRIRAAETRYALSLVALVLMILCPVATFLLANVPRSPEATDLAATVAPFAPLDLTEAVGEPAEEAVNSDIATSPLKAAQPYVLVGWAAGVLLLALRLIAGSVGVWRLRRERRELSPEITRRAAEIGRRLGIATAGRVFASRRVRDAVATGLWRPVVLLPLSWLTEMPPDVLEAVIAHELAHIRRADLWVNLLQRLAETVLFYHPAVWWLSRRMRLEREMCCDELAAAAIGERLAYANALELVASRRVDPSFAVLGAAFSGGRKMNLLHRVRYLLRPQPDRDGDRWWPAGLLALVLPVALWAASMNPLAAGPRSSDADNPRESRPVAGDRDQPARSRRVDRRALIRQIDDRLDEMVSKPSKVDRRALIRRLYLDLLGVLPTPDQVEAFVRDKRPDAEVRLIYQLLVKRKKMQRGDEADPTANAVDREGIDMKEKVRPAVEAGDYDRDGRLDLFVTKGDRGGSAPEGDRYQIPVDAQRVIQAVKLRGNARKGDLDTAKRKRDADVEQDAGRQKELIQMVRQMQQDMTQRRKEVEELREKLDRAYQLQHEAVRKLHDARGGQATREDNLILDDGQRAIEKTAKERQDVQKRLDVAKRKLDVDFDRHVGRPTELIQIIRQLQDEVKLLREEVQELRHERRGRSRREDDGGFAARSERSSRGSHMVVRIAADGSIVLNNKETPVGKLVEQMQKTSRATPGATLVILADSRAQHETIRKVIDAAQRTGIRLVRVAKVKDDELGVPDSALESRFDLFGGRRGDPGVGNPHRRPAKRGSRDDDPRPDDRPRDGDAGASDDSAGGFEGAIGDNVQPTFSPKRAKAKK